jgi:DHA1 family bicyclomycin/chloramphenicol resistance-like MFS transporter
LLGLAICQLMAGVLSDRFGRKRVVMIGLSLFIASSILCLYARTFSEFMLCRLFQALGAGVGSVISRVLVSDKFNRQEAVKVFSTIFPVVGLSSAIGPWVGGHLTKLWGWKSIFIFIAGFGVLILIVAYYALGNEKRPTNKRLRVAIKRLFSPREYWGLIRNIEFLGCALIIWASFCVFRCYSIESPFVFSKQGYLAEDIGRFYIPLSFAYLIGNMIAKKMINFVPLERLLRIGILFFVLGGGAMVSAALLLEHSPYTVVIPMCLITLGNGFLFPVGSAVAMTAVPVSVGGMAAGLMGAMQCLLAAACVSWIGKICQGEFIALAFFIGGIVLVGFISYLLLIVYKPRNQLE